MGLLPEEEKIRFLHLIQKLVVLGRKNKFRRRAGGLLFGCEAWATESRSAATENPPIKLPRSVRRRNRLDVLIFHLLFTKLHDLKGKKSNVPKPLGFKASGDNSTRVNV